MHGRIFLHDRMVCLLDRAAFIPIIGWLLGVLGVLGLFVCWLIAIIQAFQGKRFVIPVIGPLAAKQAGV